MFSQKDFEKLESRLGRANLRRRLRRQVEHIALRLSDGGLKIHWENFELGYTLLQYLLKGWCLYSRGMRNAVDYRVEMIVGEFEKLPGSFDNFSILHLSDLHSDAFVDRGQKLEGIIRRHSFDLCVITGDFRFLTFGDYEKAIFSTANLLKALQCDYGVYAVLGNHDFIEFVPSLEAAGIRVLLNEAVPIRRGDSVIWIGGVDDPHFYGLHNLERTFGRVPEGDFKILLVHSPDIIEDAADFLVDYYLCGHTHGGQICLPGGIPLITNATCKRMYTSGRWRFEEMAGYTSRGAGSSGLAVRFFCPPEITLHRLVQK